MECNVIVSDRDTLFTSASWEELTASLGTSLARFTAHHPTSTDEQTERTNRSLEEMLRHFVSPAQDGWDKHLDAAEFAIKNAWQESAQNTPFVLKTGQHPLTLASADIDHFLEDQNGQAGLDQRPAKASSVC